ncbi:glycoside hydrolase family 88 protein [Hufsiella ginkgonis]|uniref:Glucuronyl hydrolase n=1 Tax=Hufsiella ginkgonis TaxID=2695274 RepID=A0A7K1Y1A2_9SPHI|nr:glycoside hydrolase family 88 protein [Hufsiella ginkgonis]MXV17011.1 glucuronyl hydrolase [Hufsiella ginkgonis]
MNKYFILACMAMLCMSCAVRRTAKFAPRKNLLTTIDKNFADAAAQYKVMMKNLPENRFPKSFDAAANKLVTSDSQWWCSGFYPGTMLYLYEQTKDPALYAETNRILKVLEKEKLNTSTHDLGFMMFCSFGNANRIAPSEAYKDILVTSARSLSTRFSPKVNAIKSWDSKIESDFLVIIDNMMNLELLFWATKVTGDSSYYKIAVTHANTTIKNHFRPDYSSYHVINYNKNDGSVKEKKTAQGYANESAWARGQAWGLYGFTVMYRETKDKKYLDQAQHIAEYILNHPNLPSDKVPYWDFNAPGMPNVLRDASAASVAASALLELCKYTGGEAGQKYFTAAETMITSLSSDTYKAAAGTNGGFILKHGVGHLPAKSEVDVPLTYGDYYFVEAMERYKAFK